MLAKKTVDFSGKEVEIYFTGWKFLEDRNKFEPQWGYPHYDGCRDAIMYPSMNEIRHILKRLPEESKKGSYVVDLKVEAV